MTSWDTTADDVDHFVAGVTRCHVDVTLALRSGIDQLITRI